MSQKSGKTKTKSHFECVECGYNSPSYLGRCPACQQWSTFQEVVEHKAPAAGESNPYLENRQQLSPALGLDSVLQSRGVGESHAIKLSEVNAADYPRIPSGFEELDRVLGGGGWTPGSFVLLGGDPGIGKSTLMLQGAARFATAKPMEDAQNAPDGQGSPAKTVLYVAGEESAPQVKQRAERMGIDTETMHLLCDIDVRHIIAEVQRLRPQLVVVDSIQSIADSHLNSPPGSITQVKHCAALLMGMAKGLNVITVMIGHVTKEGSIGGPKLLEHMVDTVLYFEGDQYKDLRLLRTLKNRFGSTQEMGVFEMVGHGLVEVSNPSQLFLSEQTRLAQPGSVVICTMEGSRPLLVELQALVGYSAYATPRRVATGVSVNRVHQIVAVLERRLGLSFAHQDIYINIVGGIQIDEPAADLGLALALVTSLRNVSLTPGTVVVGEVGLTGEVRPVRRWKDRVSEAWKIGFDQMILPQSAHRSAVQELGTESFPGFQTIGTNTLMDAILACLPREALEAPQPQPSPEERFGQPGHSGDSLRYSAKRWASAGSSSPSGETDRMSDVF